MTRTIIRGDTYGVRRPFYTYTFVDADSLPLDLTSCTIRVTYKPTVLPAATDPTDTTAVIKHFVTIDATGVVTAADGLTLDTTAAAGVLVERLTPAETLALPVATELFNDVELTDENGEVFTWLYAEPLVAVDAYTNRTSDV